MNAYIGLGSDSSSNSDESSAHSSFDLYHKEDEPLSFSEVAAFVYSEGEHPDPLRDGMRQLREEGLLVDATLIVGSHTYHIHKALLAARSAYFRSLFGSDFQEKDKKEYKLGGISEAGFSALVDLLYTGTVVVTVANLVDILQAGDYFQVSQLLDAASCAMDKYRGPDTFASFLQLAYTYNVSNKATLQTYVLQNMSTLVEERLEEVLSLPLQIFIDLIKSDNLGLFNEEEVLGVVVKWLCYDQVRKRHMTQVLKHVRYLLVPREELEFTVGCNSWLKESEEFIHWMETAIAIQEGIIVDHASAGTATKFRQAVGITLSRPRYLAFTRDGDQFEVTMWKRRQRHLCLVANVPRPPPGVLGLVVVVGNFIFVIADKKIASKTLHRYDFISMRWLKMADMQHARTNFGLACIGDSIMVVGGFPGGEDDEDVFILSSTEVYNVHENKWSPGADYPRPMCNAAMIFCDGKKRGGTTAPQLYGFGGQTHYSGACTADVFSLGSEHGASWAKLPPMTKARKWHTAVHMEDAEMILIVGGVSGREFIDTVEAFDVKSQQWTRLESALYELPLSISGWYISGKFVCLVCRARRCRCCDSIKRRMVPTSWNWTAVGN